MILELETRLVMTEEEFRKLFPHIKFPEELTDSHILEYGYQLTDKDPKPKKEEDPVDSDTLEADFISSFYDEDNS